MNNQLFLPLFPPQVDVGQKQTSILEWMLFSGMGWVETTAPRELIHLLATARDVQLRAYELGGAALPKSACSTRQQSKEPCPNVSKVRFEQTLCAEYTDLKPFLDRLEGEKTQQNPETLAKLWRLPEERAAQIADELAEVGFSKSVARRSSPCIGSPSEKGIIEPQFREPWNRASYESLPMSATSADFR